MPRARHPLGLDHLKLTFKFQGRNFRGARVAGDVIHPLKEAVPDCFVLRKPVDAAVLLELLACFDSDGRYGSPMREMIEDRARRGKM